MSASSYDEALARLLVHEGGYTNHPADPGGPTNFGITLADARAYWKRDASAADVRAMPLAVAKTIYRTRYWAALCCDQLPAGVDYAVFDYGVNSGIGRASKVLQRILDVPPDGRIGARTIAAARSRDASSLVDAICDERLAFLQGLPTWPVFGNGWGRRVREVRTTARAMAQRAANPPASPPAPAKPARGLISLLTTLVSFLTNRKGD
jgi:lysozyme family protein